MYRLLTFGIFLMVGSLLIGGFHYYIWARLIRDTKLPRWLERILFSLLIVLGISMPFAMSLTRSLPRDSFQWLFLLLFGWMGMTLFLVGNLALSDVIRLVLRAAAKVSRSEQPTDPTKRLTMARVFASVVTLASMAMGVYGVKSARGKIPVKWITVPLKRLPAAMNGTVIVQITDVHIGPTLGHDFMAQIVHQINELKPDVVAITGDLVDGTTDELRKHVAPLAELVSKYGTYFVTGNHEYYSGVNAWLEELPKLKIRVLRNEHVSIGEDENSFDLAGVDDYSSHRYHADHGDDVQKAVDGRDTSRELVLLAHQPRTLKKAIAAGVGLQISGHTHGGQLYPWNFLIKLQQPVLAGLHLIKDTYIYVSRGTGYWGPPMRVGAPPEITRIELVRA
jgi:uncharacterized protein